MKKEMNWNPVFALILSFLVIFQGIFLASVAYKQRAQLETLKTEIEMQSEMQEEIEKQQEEIKRMQNYLENRIIVLETKMDFVWER